MKTKSHFMDWLLKQAGVLMIEWHGGKLYFRGQLQGWWVFNDTGKCGYQDPQGKFHSWHGSVEKAMQMDIFEN